MEENDILNKTHPVPRKQKFHSNIRPASNLEVKVALIMFSNIQEVIIIQVRDRAWFVCLYGEIIHEL